MASSACSSTQNPPKKNQKISYIDLTSNESSPQPNHAQVNTTLALSTSPHVPSLTMPLASPIAKRALIFTTPPNTPVVAHPYLSTMNDVPPRPTNPLLYSLTQNPPQQLQNEATTEPTIPTLNPISHQNHAQPNSSNEMMDIHQEIQNHQTLHQNIEEAIQNAQHVQESLIPPTSITHVYLPPPFPPTTTQIQTPPFDPMFPLPNVFDPIDQTLWINQPPKPQEHTCPHCERTEAMINSFQAETRFMLNHILERFNKLFNHFPRNDH